MIEMILPDGSKRQLENPMTVVEFAKSIGSSLGKATVGAIIDGVQVDPSHIIDKSGTIEIITNTSEKGIEIIRHSAAHIMAQAVQRLFPNTKVTIGPVIENGFFYDFDPEKPFTEEDLAKIEEEMAKIVKENGVEKISYVKDSFKQAVNYLKRALKNNAPVMCGVDNKPKSPNKDAITDHFIVIVGMGTDEKGNYFLFYDNATGNTEVCTSSDNKLYCYCKEHKIEGVGDEENTYIQNFTVYKKYILSRVIESIKNKK